MIDGDLEYLERAADRAEAHLRASGRHEWVTDVRLMIGNHHKVRAYRGPHAETVEAVMRADWVDDGYGAAGGLALRVREPPGRRVPLRPLLRTGWCMDARYAIRHPRRPLPMLRW